MKLFALCLMAIVCLTPTTKAINVELVTNPPKMVTIGASYAFRANIDKPDSYIIFTIGNNIQIFREAKPVTIYSNERAYKISPTANITAVLVVLKEDGKIEKRLMYGDNSGYNVYRPPKSDVMAKRLRSFNKRTFIRDGSPDAATRHNGKAYFFKGCLYSIRKNYSSWGKPQDVRDLGLPCNIDAAFYRYIDNTTYIIRGDQVWLWAADGCVEQHPFSDYFTLQDNMVLKPYTE